MLQERCARGAPRAPRRGRLEAALVQPMAASCAFRAWISWVYFGTLMAGPAAFFCNESLSSFSRLAMRSASLAFFLSGLDMEIFRKVVLKGRVDEVLSR